MSKLIASLVGVVLAFGWVSPARADQLFNDREAFLAAITGEVVIDFEHEPLGPVVGDPWLPLGLVFDEAGIGDSMVIGAGCGVDKNIFAGSSEEANIDISFPTPVAAFGLGIFSNDFHSPNERIVFRGVDTGILMNVGMPRTNFFPPLKFVGYIADEPIGLVQFIEDDGDRDYVGIGDVALTVIPEPSTLVLLGIGAVGLLAYAWRRRRS